MRTAIWEFVRRLDHEARLKGRGARGFADLAREIATWPVAPVAPFSKLCNLCPEHTCPQPINYLVNGTPPNEAPLGLAGLLPAESCIQGSRNYQKVPFKNARLFLGCNFRVLAPLAMAKGGRGPKLSDTQCCGFNLPQPAGLAILFGPWSDFCLHCWQSYPDEWQPLEGPILILHKSYGPLARQMIAAGWDWGARQVANLFDAPDPATRNLFSAMMAAAEHAPVRSFTSLSLQDREILKRFIASKRILVYQVWPWFYCSQNLLPEGSEQDQVAYVPCLDGWIRALINCLRPQKIATLGAWAYTADDYGMQELAEDVRSNRPTLFARRFLNGTAFEGYTGPDPRVRHLCGPEGDWNSPPRDTGKMKAPWFFHIPEYQVQRRLPTNAEAFVQFLTEESG